MEMWSSSGDVARDSGTAMHESLECFYNGTNFTKEQLSTKENQQFQIFYRDHPYLRPYRTEWRVYNEKMRLAGSIDMVFYDERRGLESGELILCDWKRSSKLLPTNYRDVPRKKEYGYLDVLSKVPNISLYLYTLQLNMYKYMLEANYGVRITEMFLINLHPDHEEISYHRIDVKDWSETIMPQVVAYRESLVNEDSKEIVVQSSQSFMRPPSQKRKHGGDDNGDAEEIVYYF